ncbi:MAG: type III-B CRISPR-associated protein Cas10/Cmr2 [Saprospiraceae bacterium]|nr:type III-B CRISPR-associated protein Cas10/Cmr2 [Saprospiraceae bacterium]
MQKNGYEDVLERTDINSLLTCWKEVFEGKPISSYYALVAFDGDQMGKILSGDTNFFKGNDLQNYQGEVSRLLTAFANNVKGFFKNKDKGAVAYSGGDDFLGFVNLAELFEVMRWLRTEFHKQVSMELSKAGYFKDNIDFTFSTGIVIAHYKTPLSIVLDKAREMEKLAKSPKGGDRDAFAISVLKKSGESHETFFRWELAKGLKFWTAIERLVGYFEEGYCSDTFVRNLATEFSSLQDGAGNITDSGMVKLELSRLVKRSMTEKGKQAGKTAEIQTTVETLMISNKRKEGNFKLELLTEAIGIALFLKINRKKQQPEIKAKIA